MSTTNLQEEARRTRTVSVQSAMSDATPKERSRRGSLRPSAFDEWHLSMPPPSTTYARSHNSSRPQSASFYRAALVEVHAALYSRGDREEVLDCLQRCYESDAVFENPFTMVTGRDGIANHFSLMALLPGEVYDELGEISESEDYDGARTIVFTHTMHLALIPGLGPPPLTYSRSYASFPATPYETQTPYDTSPTESPASGIRAHLPRFRMTSASTIMPNENGELGGDRRQTIWPMALAFSSLKPSLIFASLTTVHLRVITTLKFNEAGKIVHHEDTWGLKEVVEGFVPIAGRLYWLQRKAIGTAASGLARCLGLGSKPPASPASDDPEARPVSSATAPATAKSTSSQGLGLMDLLPVANGKVAPTDLK